MLVEIVEHHLGNGVALEHNNESLTGATTRFIANIGDARQAALLHELCYTQREVVGVYLIRKFGDNETRAPVDFFDGNHGAHRD